MKGNKNFYPVSLSVNPPLTLFPSREVVFIISIGKGSYVFFTGLQGQAFQVWRKNLPCDICCEVFFAQNLANPKHCPFKPM